MHRVKSRENGARANCGRHDDRTIVTTGIRLGRRTADAPPRPGPGSARTTSAALLIPTYTTHRTRQCALLGALSLYAWIYSLRINCVS